LKVHHLQGFAPPSPNFGGAELSLNLDRRFEEVILEKLLNSKSLKIEESRDIFRNQSRQDH
jgi:hypothetical protein